MVCYAGNLNQWSAGGTSGAIPFCVTTPAGFYIGDNRMKVLLKCQQCGLDFKRYPSDLNRHIGSGRYCSKKCSNSKKRKYAKVVAKCKKCNATFSTTTNKINSGRGIYCSVKCRRESQRIQVSGGNNCNWQGFHKTSNGYIAICTHTGKYESLQHIIMEREIGRKLKKDELIHHKNGIKDDNRIENLELTTKSNHAKFHTTKRHKEGVFYGL